MLSRHYFRTKNEARQVISAWVELLLRPQARARLGDDEIPDRVRENPYHQGHRGLTKLSTVRGKLIGNCTRVRRVLVYSWLLW